MSSTISQYIDEIRTCADLAADVRTFLRLTGRTEQFHLRNMLRRGSREADGQVERNRIRLGGAERDLWLRPRTGDWFVFHEVFKSECYRIPERVLPNAETIVDLGANIGLVTMFLAQSYPDARYICVEPDARNAEVLRRNVDWPGSRACVVESAVTDYCGEISFEDSGWSWGRRIEREKAGGRRVRCTTMAALLESQAVDFVDLLKVDIEGAEEFIFGGNPGWLSKVGCIVIELHGQYSFERFERDVAPQGFRAVAAGSELGNAMTMAISTRRMAGGETEVGS